MPGLTLDAGALIAFERNDRSAVALIARSHTRVLCGVRGTNDIVDASVVLCARARRHRIVTSDPDDLRRLDSDAVLIAV